MTLRARPVVPLHHPAAEVGARKARWMWTEARLVTREARLLLVARRAGADITLGLKGVVVGAPPPIGHPVVWVELHAARAERIPALAVRLPGYLRLLVAVHAEGLKTVAAAAVGAVLTRGDRVLKDPVVGVELQGLLQRTAGVMDVVDQCMYGLKTWGSKQKRQIHAST